MAMRKCPNCNTEIDEMELSCPNCGEILFEEPIEVEEVSEELLEETLEDMIAEESIVTRGVVKGWIGFIKLVNFIKDKLLLGAQFVVKNVGKYIKKFFSVYLVEFIKKIVVKTKLNRLVKHITYVNMLACAIVVSTTILVYLCARNFIYLDTKSNVSKVNDKTTYNNIKKIYDEEGDMSLDMTDGTIVYTYKDQEVAGIKCDVYYKINPDNNKVLEVYFIYKKNVFSTGNMRNYLIVNYGEPKVKGAKEVWKYEDDKITYTFTNGAYDSDVEQVCIRYKENAPSKEENEKYNAEHNKA